MRIQLLIETHAYAKDRLCDDILDPSLPDDIQSCGILGPEIILPLRRNRCCELYFEYTNRTIISEVIDTVLAYIDSIEHDIRIGFISNGIRYWVEDPNANFSNLVKQYLDPLNTGCVRVGAYVSMNAGAIDKKDGIYYYMNSRERGRHHEPHVHICDSSREHKAVIFIRDGTVIGDFPPKLLKNARKRVLANQKFFLSNWNALTDGLKVDINNYLGIIQY